MIFFLQSQAFSSKNMLMYDLKKLMSNVPCFLYGKLLVRETCNSNIQIICQEYVLLKYLLLMYVECLARGLARNSEIKFPLPSLRANNSNQMKIKDSGCQFHVHFGLERIFE